MAPLLSRLFSSRRNSVRSNSDVDVVYESNNWKSPEFNVDQIRVLLFRECDWRGRKLLFDSKSVKKVQQEAASPQCSPSKRYNYMRLLNRNASNVDSKPPMPPASRIPSTNDACIEITSNGQVYQYLHPRSDAKMLGEMIFGSVAMSYKGSMMKIHTIRSSPQLMLSKVFPAPTKSFDFEDGNHEDSCNLQCSGKEIGTATRPFTISTESLGSSSVAHSIPVDVPDITKSTCRQEDSGLPASGDLSESLDSLGSYLNFGAGSPDGYSSSNSSLTHSGSYSSLQRRWLHNLTTSFEYGWKPTTPEYEEVGLCEQRKSKLGMAVVFSLPEGKNEEERLFQEFFFSHISLIERHFKVFQTSVCKAYLSKKDFVHNVMQALISFRMTISDLYQAPRLPSPVWLSLMSHGLHSRMLCQRFITEFADLISDYDVKNTNFFVSALLTAVLTHHLSWVPTITPPGVPSGRSYHQKHSAKWLDLLAKSHPYNPLWVQLEDLYGVLGFPKRVSRTVISGKRKDLVRKFLFVLTYFIRCSELKESVEELDLSEENIQFISPQMYDRWSNLHKIPEMNARISDWAQTCKPSASKEYDDNPTRFDDARTDSKFKIFNATDEADCADDSKSDILHSGPPRRPTKCLPLIVNRPSTSRDINADMTTSLKSPDDVFFCRTPDLDSGISEESAEDLISIPNNRTSLFTVESSSDVDLSVPSKRGSNFVGSGDADNACKSIVVSSLDKDTDSSDNRTVTSTVSSNHSLNNIIDVNSPCKQSADVVSNVSKLQRLLFTRKPSTGTMVGSETEEEVGTPVPQIIIDKCYATKDEEDSDVSNEENVHTITQTSQLLKEYMSVRFTFEHNLSALDKNLDDNAEDADYYERKITDARNTFYVRSDSLISQHEDGKSSADSCSGVNSCECCRCNKKFRVEDTKPASISSIETCTLANLAEVQLPRSIKHDDKSMSYCFGRSLYAGYNDHFMADFCLQGMSHCPPESEISKDLHSYIRNGKHEAVTEAVCIIADTDTWSVHIESSNGSCKDMKTLVTTSQLVSNMAESLLQLSKLKMSSDFCLMHLEDRLQELYFKSLLLTEHVRDSKMISVSKLSSSLGLDPSDIPLLMSIASTHSPYLVAAMPYS